MNCAAQVGSHGRVLAVDAGGTSTRAVLVDRDGMCTGTGRAGSGNPISVGPQAATDSVVAAAGQAAAGAGQVHVDLVLVAMAGMSAMVRVEPMRERLADAGVHGPVQLGSDLLAMFCSGTPLDRGYALVGGTGSIAARVEAGQTVRIAGGNGWLLGDVGSGFWLGQQVARAVVADLDRLGPATALTGMLLDGLALAGGGSHEGRPAVLVSLLDTLYRMRPVELARFAPLAFAADPVAEDIRRRGGQALAELLAATYADGIEGPVVIGGSVARAILADQDSPLTGSLAGREVITVDDGLAGAAVMGLRASGFPVDDQVFDRLVATLRELRGFEEGNK